MTSINGVPRELLERAVSCMGEDGWETIVEELSALLAERPQAGAGQDVPDVVRQFVESQTVCSDCHLDETCCRPLLRAAKEAFAAAPQPPARHDQGDEVLRDAQRYRYMRAHAIFERRNGPGLYWYLPRNLTGGAANQLDQAIDAAQTPGDSDGKEGI